jgi:hypothetical protein
MRTSPKTNPVMACDYDDESGSAPLASGNGNAQASGSGASSLNQVEDGDDTNMDNGGKKKRKANSGKKRDDDESRATLMKRIRKSNKQETWTCV